MNSTEIFSMALGLCSLWYVERVGFVASGEGERELHLHINFERGYKFESGSGERKPAYDTIERTWQHLNFFQHRCYLHARVPRIERADGGIHQWGNGKTA
jgi:hypothetical protein